MYEDGGVLVGQLIPQGVARTWVPGDLRDQIPAENQNPLLALSKATVFAYNVRAPGEPGEQVTVTRPLALASRPSSLILRPPSFDPRPPTSGHPGPARSRAGPG
ncbi:hypothetical protein [Streptosporangium sp. V21-05]|uniref:hypothetical protein n=1 Tax=Streptosporangium sp. V21-05 TaxID=3446115 RepID=UPI003F52DCF2